MTPYFHEITSFLANTFFQLNAMDKLFDGDPNSCKTAIGGEPFVRVQLLQSTQIDQLDITMVLGRRIMKE